MKRLIRKHVKNFSKDLKKTINTGITAALGLIVANSWKGVIEEWLVSIPYVSVLQGKIIAALFITFVAALTLFFLSKMLK